VVGLDAKSLITEVATKRSLCEHHHMRRGKTIPWILYTAGALCLAVGISGKGQLAIIAMPLLLAGAVLHRRRPRPYGATSAYVGTELMNSPASRPGLRDRYEGIVNSLMRWD
jgi:hypothetical protein